MKVGDVFEHPLRDTGETVQLVACPSKNRFCDGCIFMDGVNECYSKVIGYRDREITGTCYLDDLIFKFKEE